MRATLWLLALFGIAVALALLLGNNQATVTLFWPPHRLDVSLNFAVLVLIGAFLALYLAVGALQALFAMPEKTRRWRALQRERALHTALHDGMADMLAGRFVRARRAAQTALGLERVLQASGELLPQAAQIKALCEWLAAESAHMLQDKPVRDAHAQAALGQKGASTVLREGIQLRAARWALDDRDAGNALERLTALPQGVARRTLALRIKLKAARLAGQSASALETAALLAKHKAFSPSAAQSLLKALALDHLASARDTQQLERSMAELPRGVRELPDVALAGVQRALQLQRPWVQADDTAPKAVSAPTQPPPAGLWLDSVWANYDDLSDTTRTRLASVLTQWLAHSEPQVLGAGPGAPAWLPRLEQALATRSRDARLHYLTGVACMQRQLWGKAQLHLNQATQGLSDSALRRDSWRRLAQLASTRGDTDSATRAWQEAARV